MSDSITDRNLLFGVLALQMDFISRDALIAAMNAWVLDKTKPLDRILLDQRAFSAEVHGVLAAVVQKHIDQHRGDPHQSLLALRSLHSAQLTLEIADEEVQASLVRLASQAPSAQSTLISPQHTDGERFQILRPHASGGLGEVFVAQDHELNRQVALKRIHERHSGSRDNNARFLQEAEITGGLEHPGIVPVYALGVAADGRPHYAMRFIRGETLKSAIEQFHAAESRSEGDRRVELRQLLTRFIAVCNAVEYAHSRGVIHRDLKPSNIMLGKYGETLVVNWGLAKALQQRDEAVLRDEETLIPSASSGSSETLPGSAIGTPGYMSPEQAAGRTAEIGPASDIYSLGATLYAVISGAEPFETGDIGAVLQRVQNGDFAPPRERNRTVPPALEAIVLKAMQRAPTERYPSCAALASDVEHWLADEPVTAFRDPVSTRVARWIKRHRWLAAASAALVACVLVGLAVRNAVLSHANTEIAGHAANAVRERQAALDRQGEATRQLYVSQMNLAQRAWDDDNVGRTRELLDSQRPERTGGIDLRGWEWHYLWRLTHSEVRALEFLSICVAFTPDGRILAAGGEDGTLKVWTADGDRELWSVKAHGDRIDRLVISGDGRLLATRSPDGTVKLWDLNSRRELRSFPCVQARYGGLAISRDGARLAIAQADGVEVRSTADGEQIHTVNIAASAIAFGPDSEQLVIGSLVGPDIAVWDLTTGEERFRSQETNQQTRTVAISPDGQLLATGNRTGALSLWDRSSAERRSYSAEHTDKINQLSFSRDGKRLVSASDDTTIRIWDTATGKVLQTLRGHASPVSGVAYSPVAEAIASSSWDGTLRLWDSASRQEPETVALPGDVCNVVYSPDKKWLAAGGGGTISVLDAQTGFVRWTDAAPLPPGVFNVVAFEPNGQFFGIGSFSGQLLRRNAEEGRVLNSFQIHQSAITSVAFHPGGQIVATGSSDRSVRLTDSANGQNLSVLMAHSDEVSAVAFSPDGKLLASAGYEKDRQIVVWDVATRQQLQSCVGHEGGIVCLAFSRDSRHLYSSSQDEMIRMWDVATGKTVRIHRGHSGTALALSLSPDGQRLASAGSDQCVKIWDVATGQELLTLKTNVGILSGIAFHPDGARLAAGGSLRSLVVWDARPLTAELRRELVAADRVRSLFAEQVLQSDVLKSLQSDEALSDVDRNLALALAQQIADRPWHLNNLSWDIVRQPNLRIEDYQSALRWAARACELAPDSAQSLNTLGAAQFRVGDHALALQTLLRSKELNAGTFGRPIPADLAFLAMASHFLGRQDDAAQCLNELRKALDVAPWNQDPESQRLLREAESLIVPAAEAPARPISPP